MILFCNLRECKLVFGLPVNAHYLAPLAQSKHPVVLCWWVVLLFQGLGYILWNLLCANNWSKYLIYLVSFSSQNHPVRKL